MGTVYWSLTFGLLILATKMSVLLSQIYRLHRQPNMAPCKLYFRHQSESENGFSYDSSILGVRFINQIVDRSYRLVAVSG